MSCDYGRRKPKRLMFTLHYDYFVINNALILKGKKLYLISIPLSYNVHILDQLIVLD